MDIQEHLTIWGENCSFSKETLETLQTEST